MIVFNLQHSPLRERLGLRMKSLVYISAILGLFLLPVNLVFGAWSSTGDVAISRTYDRVEAGINEPVTVTVSFTNSHTSIDMKGFYFSEQIPAGLTVNTVSVKIDGADVSIYIYEVGLPGDVYTSFTPHRWILETPPGFTENNPIPFGDSILEIVYTVTSSQKGTFNFDHFNWVGYYEGATDSDFGHSEVSDKVAILVSNKDELAVNFAAFGLYHYANGTWTKINDGEPENMLGIGMDLYADFGGESTGGYGLYRYDGSWTRLSRDDAEDMCAVGSDLYVDFGSIGLWRYAGAGWDKVSSSNPEDMVAVGQDLYVDFGGESTGGYGLYRYDGSWTRLSGDDAEDMCAVDLE